MIRDNCKRVLSDLRSLLRDLAKSARHDADTFRKHGKAKNERCR